LARRCTPPWPRGSGAGSRGGTRTLDTAQDRHCLGPAGPQHPDLRRVPSTDSVGGWQAHNARSLAGSANRAADRESEDDLPPECIPLHREPARGGGSPDELPAPAPRHPVPDLPARGIRCCALAAVAVVGTTRPAARPLPPDVALGDTRLGAA